VSSTNSVWSNPLVSAAIFDKPVYQEEELLRNMLYCIGASEFYRANVKTEDFQNRFRSFPNPGKIALLDP